MDKLVQTMRENAQADNSQTDNVIDDDALKSINGGCGSMGPCQPNPFSATLCPDGSWLYCQ